MTTFHQTVRLTVLLAGGAAAVLAGGLGFRALEEGGPWWWVGAGVLLSLAAVALGWPLLWMADTTNARHGITRDLLDGTPVSPVAGKDGPERLRRYRRTPLRFWWARWVALGAGAALSVAGVAVIFSAVSVGQAAEDLPSALVAATGFAVYVVGLLLAVSAWKALVEPAPPVPAADEVGGTGGHRALRAATVATAFLLGWWAGRRARDEEEPS